MKKEAFFCRKSANGIAYVSSACILVLIVLVLYRNVLVEFRRWYIHLSLGGVCFKYEKTMPEFTLKFACIQLILKCSI